MDQDKTISGQNRIRQEFLEGTLFDIPQLYQLVVKLLNFLPALDVAK